MLRSGLQHSSLQKKKKNCLQAEQLEIFKIVYGHVTCRLRDDVVTTVAVVRHRLV
jgi:hypothetical protein